MYFLIALFLVSKLWATELFLTAQEAKQQGFRVVTYAANSSAPYQKLKKNIFKTFQHSRFEKQNKNFNISNFSSQLDLAPHELAWPFEHPYHGGFLGNTMAQYQPYSPPGYHGGNDMVLERDSWIYAPIDGVVEAGHYAYTQQPDGSRIKQWKAWPADGDETYFEVAVISNNGMRFELHHVDKHSLPNEIVNGLNHGHLEVKKGDKLGRLIHWGTLFHYDHVHVNIIDPQGRWYNPEYYFALIPDTSVPRCQVLAQNSNGTTDWVNETYILSSQATHFIFICSDQKDHSSFSQVPLYFEVSFNHGDQNFWDFRQNLIGKDQSFADFRKVYPETVDLPNGKSFSQPDSYYPNSTVFAVTLEIPKNHGDGQFVLKAADIAGNTFLISSHHGARNIRTTQF